MFNFCLYFFEINIYLINDWFLGDEVISINFFSIGEYFFLFVVI